ncbi:MAG: sulfotransferase [Gloeomargaritaceae cyanobacterium C42_A2020_066]|nr:sulfotransferase [Gloeomargaritaceae cyanobacterium C42_A2020_066]
MGDSVLIGGMCGSGTRVLSKCLRKLGVFMGGNLNRSEDSVPFIPFYYTWTSLFLAKAPHIPQSISTKLKEELHICLDEHLKGLEDRSQIWGLKNPRSIHLLDLWLTEFPNMKFIHFIRNGLDMAFVDGQALEHHYMHRRSLLADRDFRYVGPSNMALFWAKLNQVAAAQGAHYGDQRYLLVRHEDICSEPVETMRSILAFLSMSVVDSQIQAAAQDVQKPETAGRWRFRPPHEIYAVMSLIRPALEQFGYWSEENWRVVSDTCQSPTLLRKVKTFGLADRLSTL